MSEIVKNELDAIKAFETETEKRRSTLTLNELNYISDKQLHKKSEEPGPVSEEYFDLIVMLNQTAGTAETVYGSYEDFKSKIAEEPDPTPTTKSGGNDNIVKVAATGVEAQTGTLGTAAFWFTNYVSGDPEYMQFAVVSNNQIIAVYWLSDGTWSLVDPTNGGNEDPPNDPANNEVS